MSIESVKNSVSSELNSDIINNLKNTFFNNITELEQNGVGFKDLMREFLNNTPSKVEQIIESAENTLSKIIENKLQEVSSDILAEAESKISELPNIASVEFNKFGKYTSTITDTIINDVESYVNPGILCSWFSLFCPKQPTTTMDLPPESLEQTNPLLMSGEMVDNGAIVV